MNPSDRIVFFDGVCNLCNRSVRIILKNDRRGVFHLASLQSTFAQNFLRNNKGPVSADTILLYDRGRWFIRSRAIFKIAARLRFPYPILAAGVIIPAFITDPVYNFIARNRYRWFGKRASCMIPEPEWRSRFLSE